MAKFSIDIPDQFLEPLGELAMENKLSPETWLRNMVGNILIDYQVRKEYGQQIQQRTAFLARLWS